ncbi:hypothetical protein Tco_1124090 [Tanacetum coccineum]|uniref:Uncharacterized protein n=1 Tax=Tanacetum coccineum TaxID=301880 RepID=A0ABQ5J6L8_9ASTR
MSISYCDDPTGLSQLLVEETVVNQCMQNQFHLSSLVGDSGVMSMLKMCRHGTADLKNLRESSSSCGKRKRSTQHNQICSQTYPMTNARNVRARSLTGCADADVASFCAVYQTLNTEPRKSTCVPNAAMDDSTDSSSRQHKRSTQHNRSVSQTRGQGSGQNVRRRLLTDSSESNASHTINPTGEGSGSVQNQVAAMNSDSHDDSATVACDSIILCSFNIAYKYLKHPIKLLYSVELTIVPSLIFVSLVPGSIGINVSLQSIILASFRILLAYADCFIEMSPLVCVTYIPR